jgi:manganese/zinc/iron transport system substrate-binding protein
MKYYSVIIGIALFFLFSACEIRENRSDHPVIVCTTSIIADGVTEIVGNDVEVVSLMGPGIDPHAYNPRPRDVFYLNNATLIVYNGCHLEGKMVALFEKIAKRKRVVAVATTYPKRKLIHADGGSTVDPHIWFDPTAWKEGMKGVVSELKRCFPKYKNSFQLRFDSFEKRVEAQERMLRLELSQIPPEQRVLITSHDAFHYFGRCFGVKVKALQGISTTQEPGVKDVVELVDFIVRNRIKAIFVEHSVSPKTIQTVLQSCERLGHKVKIGGTLYSDALGEKKQLGGTYLGMLQHNVETIKKGLME